MSAAPVVLVGLMGSGKTTVGRLVAERTGRPLVDLDDEVARRSGRSVAEIFAAHGEQEFRRLELAALRDTLARTDSPVVAAGGGVVVTPEGRAALRTGATVVWLQVAAAVAADRVGSDPTRPLLGDDPVGTLQRLDAERRDHYAAVATHAVDAGGEPEATAELVLAMLGEVAA